MSFRCASHTNNVTATSVAATPAAAAIDRFIPTV